MEIMKVKLLAAVLFTILAGCNTGEHNSSKNSGNGTDKNAQNPNVIYLTDQSFKELVFDYEKYGSEWKYEGTKPAIIDFYADWCAPCRELSPLLEEVVQEYDGRVVLYKIDTEKEKELTKTMGVSALPTLLYIPMEGKPQVRMGMAPRGSLKQAIDEILLNKK